MTSKRQADRGKVSGGGKAWQAVQKRWTCSGLAAASCGPIGSTTTFAGDGGVVGRLQLKRTSSPLRPATLIKPTQQKTKLPGSDFGFRISNLGFVLARRPAGAKIKNLCLLQSFILDPRLS